LLARENNDHQFTYFGELRAEGIKPETAKLLREANFTEVEIGLQSVDPLTQDLMDRRNNMKAFERGVAALLDAGIDVKVDLIIGLPGDTVASVRRGFDYLATNQLFSSTQVFNLAILPGTAFRAEAEQLGLQFQPRPPYYVLETPTLTSSDLYTLMGDAQDVFQTEWDPFPEPKLEFQADNGPIECVRVDYDSMPNAILPEPQHRAQALTLWFQGSHLDQAAAQMQRTIEQVLSDCPHSTLQIILEPRRDGCGLSASTIDKLLAACYQHPNYLDRYYSLNPMGLLGSKRALVMLDSDSDMELDQAWLAEIEEVATIIEVAEEREAS
jgi:hypothetical protein